MAGSQREALEGSRGDQKEANLEIHQVFLNMCANLPPILFGPPPWIPGLQARPFLYVSSSIGTDRNVPPRRVTATCKHSLQSHRTSPPRLTKFLILWWSLSSYFSPNELADGHVLLDNNPSVVFLKKTVLKLTAFSSSRISNCSQRSWTTKFPKYPVIWPKSQIHWHFTSHWFCEGTTGAPIRPKDDWAQATHGGAGRVYT